MSRGKPISGARWRRSAPVLPLLAVGLLAGCAPQPEAIQTELFPEKEHPFKTCIAKLEGTYRERELQQHYVIDIYKSGTRQRPHDRRLRCQRMSLHRRSAHYPKAHQQMQSRAPIPTGSAGFLLRPLPLLAEKGLGSRPAAVRIVGLNPSTADARTDDPTLRRASLQR